MSDALEWVEWSLNKYQRYRVVWRVVWHDEYPAVQQWGRNGWCPVTKQFTAGLEAEARSLRSQMEFHEDAHARVVVEIAELRAERDRYREALEEIVGPCADSSNKARRRTGQCRCDPCTARRALSLEADNE